jgi:hypothetical protein
MITRLVTLLLYLPFGAGAATVAQEGKPFTLDQAGRVSYGVGTAWASKDLPAGTYMCGNALFGDPVLGKVKACNLPIKESGTFRVSQASVVLYGSGAKFTTKALQPGDYTCGNALFGDPASGIKKQCYATGMLDSIDCYPAQLGGTGSRAAWGVSLSPVQAWAGWWCAGRVQIVACSGAGCRPDLARMVINTTSDILYKTLVGARTDDIGSTAMRGVWEPHWAEIVATRQ